MAIIPQYSRIAHHTLFGATGLTFSLPPSEDFTDGSWNVTGTELFLSEIGVSEDDNKAYIRIGNNINEFSFGGGSIGATGATGPQGEVGATGSQGPIGATGPAGPQGATGSNGTNGLNGATGPAGTNGTNGLNGATGPAGPIGATGPSGDLTATLEQVLTNGNTTGLNEIVFGTASGILFNNTSRLREGTIDAGYGGNKGIAQICAVGYEMKWESGSLYIMNGDGTQIRETRYTFGATPSTSSDITKGFTIGSRWVLDNGDLYTCYNNATSSATWNLESVGAAIDITYADLYLGLTSSTLTKDATYYITDRKIWLKALDTNLLSTSGQKKQTIVRNEVYNSSLANTYGVWNDAGTYAIGDLVVWGGKVWENLTGSVGTAEDYGYGIYRTLDLTNWVEVVNTNTIYYFDKIFDIEYEIFNISASADVIISQSDDRGNVIIWDFAGDNTPYQYEVTDWGDNTMKGNVNVYVITNNRCGILYNENVYGYITNNSGGVKSNKNVNELIKNNTGFIAYNDCSYNGSISDNSGDCQFNICNGLELNSCGVEYNMVSGYISNNSLFGVIRNNTNLGNIYDNTGNGFILNNSNTGDISTNAIDTALVVIDAAAFSLTGIINNTTNGNISNNILTADDANSPCGIRYNTNGTKILTLGTTNLGITGNTLTAYTGENSNIIRNSNNGGIYDNTITGYIIQNSNNGDIDTNTQTSGTTNISNNNNNGNIGPAGRTADVLGTIVNI